MRPIRFRKWALLLISTQRRMPSRSRFTLPACLIINYPACLNHQSKCRVRGLIPFGALLTINFTSLLSLPNKEMKKNERSYRSSQRRRCFLPADPLISLSPGGWGCCSRGQAVVTGRRAAWVLSANRPAVLDTGAPTCTFMGGEQRGG